MDRMRNEDIRGTIKVERFGNKVQRRDSKFIDGRLLKMEQPGRRQEG